MGELGVGDINRGPALREVAWSYDYDIEVCNHPVLREITIPF